MFLHVLFIYLAAATALLQGTSNHPPEAAVSEVNKEAWPRNPFRRHRPAQTAQPAQPPPVDPGQPSQSSNGPGCDLPEPPQYSRHFVGLDILFIGINSKMSHIETRNYHRNSWMQHPFVKNGAVTARFLVSRGRLPQGEEDHNDMIHLSVPEDYHQLTNKTLAFMRWFNRHSNANFVMKLDDDSYPHLFGLLPLLKQHNDPLAYIGFESRGEVHRTGKYEEDDYEEDYYPPYMQGAAYVLSNRLAKSIMSHGTAELMNENTTIGVRVREVQSAIGGVKRTHMRATLFGCKEHDVVSMNWDARRFSCVYEREKAVAEERYPCPIAGQCCGHVTHGPGSHWSESADEDEPLWPEESGTEGEPEGEPEGVSNGKAKSVTNRKTESESVSED